MANTNVTNADLQLGEEIARFYDDPLGFVMFAFPWGEPGSLAQFNGPDNWQEQALREIGEEVRKRKFNGVDAVRVIRKAFSSGHGIGKGVLVGWLVCWIMSTRPFCQGTVTANSFPQLSTKTWASIQRWMKLSITAHWFDIGVERIRHRDFPESWFVSAQTCKPENSESFAGQHAANSTSFYIFDEASNIPKEIWDVAEGGITDGEPMWFVFGNPTRSTGNFYQACFGADRGLWNPTIVDSRTCRFTNKEQIAEWIAQYGLDSDFVRVRVLGKPPRAGDAQFIGQLDVFEAQQRDEVFLLPDEPLVAGLDIARGGMDDSVFRFRCGHDAFSIPPKRVPGEECRDSMRLVSLAVDLLNQTFVCADKRERRIAMLFVDGTGVGGPVYDRLVQLNYGDRVMEVGFGKKSPDDTCDNMRAYIWSQMRAWLPKGKLPKDERLETDLTTPGFGHNQRDKLVLESKESIKKRGGASPDDGDALALTFAATVARDESTTHLGLLPATAYPAMPESSDSTGWMRS